MTARTEYDALITQRNALHERLNALAKDVLTEACKELFAKHPDLTSFSWRQYTQYFNDGDATHFSAGTDKWSLDVEVNGSQVWSENSPEAGEENPNEDVEDRAAELAEEIAKVLAIFEDEDYLRLFGDHARVRVTRDVIEIEAYTEHD